jgi:hypothetical protein
MTHVQGGEWHDTWTSLFQVLCVYVQSACLASLAGVMCECHHCVEDQDTVIWVVCLYSKRTHGVG